MPNIRSLASPQITSPKYMHLPVNHYVIANCLYFFNYVYSKSQCIRMSALTMSYLISKRVAMEIGININPKRWFNWYINRVEVCCDHIILRSLKCLTHCYPWMTGKKSVCNGPCLGLSFPMRPLHFIRTFNRLMTRIIQ